MDAAYYFFVPPDNANVVKSARGELTGRISCDTDLNIFGLNRTEVKNINVGSAVSATS